MLRGVRENMVPAVARSSGVRDRPLPAARRARGTRCRNWRSASTSSRRASSARSIISPAATSRRCCWPGACPATVKLFVFDEPTVGVDVGTRVAIYEFIRDLCEAGAAILLISSDLPEILHLTNRAYVMYRGRLRAELTGPRDHRGNGGRPLLRARGGVTSVRGDSQQRPRAATLRWTAARLRAPRRAAVPAAHRGRRLHPALGPLPHWPNLLNVARQSTLSDHGLHGADAGAADRRLRSFGRNDPRRHLGGRRARHGRRCMRPIPDAVALAMALGMLGRRRGRASRSASSTASAWPLFGVSPFMMTLGMASVGFGIALYLTGGVPVYGMPQEFGDGLRASAVVRPAGAGLRHRGADRLRSTCCSTGRASAAIFYAIGGNLKASTLSGINTRLYSVPGLCAVRRR